MSHTTCTRAMKSHAAIWPDVADDGAEFITAIGKNADDVEREALTAMRSAPFDPPDRGRIAVKIVTATGMEMTAVRTLGELQP